MKGGCPKGRDCSACPYESICGGCLGGGCVHTRERSPASKGAEKCLFCQVHKLDEGCCTKSVSQPDDFALAEPELLENAVSKFLSLKIPDQPKKTGWPMLIPEVSETTETTSRLGVYPDEGEWTNPFFSSIAWDMTGNLFDKVVGAPWTFEPEICGEKDWHDILGPEENWVDDLLLIDRLPDLVAMQIPPSAAMILFLNRLMTYQRKLMHDEDAPNPWLVTHGYPSYIDWPPAWHFNLGIRMLSSLLGYLSAQSEGYMWLDAGALYPDGSRTTSQALPLPFVQTDEGNRLLWAPERTSRESRDVEWPVFPGIIPFIPGATTNQIAWFGKMMAKAGLRIQAIDAANAIANENFDGLVDAVRTLRKTGAKQVMVYGPWPLHIPTNLRPIHGVSYIPSAAQIDHTDYPARYWRTQSDNATDWQELPPYKSTSLPNAATQDWLDICDCDACHHAANLETRPQSIWRWGHLLNAGIDWVMSVQNLPEAKEEDSDEKRKLWFQGPSYTTFRRCFHYSTNNRCTPNKKIIDTLEILNSRVQIRFSDNLIIPISEVKWSWDDDLQEWSKEFPFLG